MRVCGFFAVGLASALAGAHPGNGIVALSSQSALTGDAVHNGLWRFEVGKAPARLTGEARFHCHWVTRGLDGKLYAETLSQRGGRWVETVYRLDAQGANPLEIASAEEGTFGIFAVDREGGIITLRTGSLQRFAAGKWTSFRGFGRTASNDPTLGNVRALVWGPEDRLYVADGPHIRMAGSDGVIRRVASIRGSVSDSLYAEKGGPAVWGLAVDSAGQIFAAVPSQGKIVRFDRNRRPSDLLATKEGWAPVGVAVSGDAVMVLESRTRGNVNEGPRVRMIRTNGQIVQLGTVG